MSLTIWIAPTSVFGVEEDARMRIASQSVYGAGLPQVAAVMSAHTQKTCDCGDDFWAPVSSKSYDCPDCARTKPRRKRKATGFEAE